jgi:ankyrin repeat protein
VADTTKAFLRAAKNGDLQTVKTLLAGAPELIAATDAEGSTALHGASWKDAREVVAFLIAAGADINARNQNDHWGTTPLHAAAHANNTAVVRLLIDAGADINAVDGQGRTPLEHTAFHQATAAAKLLSNHAGR